MVEVMAACSPRGRRAVATPWRVSWTRAPAGMPTLAADFLKAWVNESGVDWAAVTYRTRVEIEPGRAEGHPPYQLGSPVLAQWLELPVCRRCHRD